MCPSHTFCVLHCQNTKSRSSTLLRSSSGMSSSMASNATCGIVIGRAASKTKELRPLTRVFRLQTSRPSSSKATASPMKSRRSAST
uniref:Uncharacterized protein n=1 Tax=uncultured marine virus TaxID=186617 RepID=A0A0F7L4N9_9VIRU|nr:hypothetical protein [uncultured marine virus]